jgi:hypothetical protein
METVYQDLCDYTAELEDELGRLGYSDERIARIAENI